MSNLKTKRIQIGDNATSSNNFVIRQPDVPNGNMHIGNGLLDSSNDIVTLTSSGNVGIGTTSPEYMLHLKGSYPYIAFQDTDNGATSKHTITGNSDGNIYFDSVLNSSSGNSGFRFRQNAAAITSMSIDNAGRMLAPYQPSFFAYRDAGAVTAPNTILFNNVQHNDGSHYDSSTGRFTAPVAGRYFIHAQVLRQSSYSRLDARIDKNGVTLLEGRNHFAASGEYNHITISGVVKLSASDYLNVYVSTGEAYANGKWTWFSGHLLG